MDIRVSILTAIIFCSALVYASDAVAEGMYSSKENWGFYIDSCNRLDEAMNTVQNQINSKSDVLFSNGIKFNLERMEDSINNVLQTDINQSVYQRCIEKSEKGKKLLLASDSYERTIEIEQDNINRKEHENSEIYKKALALGFTDYGWISNIQSYYREIGDAKLRKWLLVVDSDCGEFFQATQYVKPYIIYSVKASRNTACSGKEIVAVLPYNGVLVERGEYIDQDSYYVYRGVLKGKVDDGFPIKLLSVKQFKEKH